MADAISFSTTLARECMNVTQLFWSGALLAMGVQWVAFVPAYARRTERFYDLVGSATFVLTIALAVVRAPALDPRSGILAGVVTVWAVRLGTYLVRRIHQKGRDDRFDEIKQSFARFLLAWTMQGVWVVVTSSPAVLAILGPRRSAPDAWLAMGFCVWALGFGVEVVADGQKARFAASPANRGRFIATGLWSRARHPNYFGEITLWSGVALMALPVLDGWARLALVAPAFVAWLLIRVSGVPQLERKAWQRWGNDPAYREWRRVTPRLVPRLGPPPEAS
jgi:steroid 5-alpha reductase family enzyme